MDNHNLGNMMYRQLSHLWITQLPPHVTWITSCVGTSVHNRKQLKCSDSGVSCLKHVQRWPLPAPGREGGEREAENGREEDGGGGGGGRWW